MRSVKQWLVVTCVILGISLGGALAALIAGSVLVALGDSPAVPALSGLAGVLVFCLPFMLAARAARRLK